MMVGVYCFHRGRASVCDFLIFPPSGHILKICQTHAQRNEKICKIKISDTLLQHLRIQSGDRGLGAPEKSQSYQGVNKASIQCWAIIGPFQGRFIGGPIMAGFLWYLDHLSPRQLKIEKKKNVE